MALNGELGQGYINVEYRVIEWLFKTNISAERLYCVIQSIVCE